MFHCVGCNGMIPWDGEGAFSYTCPCGARIFMNDESGFPAFPASTLIQMTKKEANPTPHLDDLVGVSEYTSPEKEQIITFLRDKGFIWMEECVQCRLDGTFQRHKKRKELDVALHEVQRRFELGELTLEEAIKEKVSVHKRFV